MRLRLTPRAAVDLSDIASYIWARNPAAAQHAAREREYEDILMNTTLLGDAKKMTEGIVKAL